MTIKRSQGNKAFLTIPKCSFLCSRHCPASAVLLAYDWAKQMRDHGVCVITGNHSQIEKDVVHYLLKGRQPVIIALARGLKKILEPELSAALAEKRLLLISPFTESVKRASQETANKRNDLMAEIAEKIFVAYAEPGGNVERVVLKWLRKGKSVETFDIPENRKLVEAGAKIFRGEK